MSKRAETVFVSEPEFTFKPTHPKTVHIRLTYNGHYQDIMVAETSPTDAQYKEVTRLVKKCLKGLSYEK